MNSPKKKTTLYFTAGSNLSEEDVRIMNSIPGGAFHRNANLVEEDDRLEPCDAVAGPAIPAQYLAAGIDVVEGTAPPEQGEVPEEMSVSELRTALTAGNIAFKASDKKADLVALYRASFEVNE